MALIRSLIDQGCALQHARKLLRLTRPQLALAAGVEVRFIVELGALRDASVGLGLNAVARELDP